MSASYFNNSNMNKTKNENNTNSSGTNSSGIIKFKKCYSYDGTISYDLIKSSLDKSDNRDNFNANYKLPDSSSISKKSRRPSLPTIHGESEISQEVRRGNENGETETKRESELSLHSTNQDKNNKTSLSHNDNKVQNEKIEKSTQNLKKLYTTYKTTDCTKPIPNCKVLPKINELTDKIIDIMFCDEYHPASRLNASYLWTQLEKLVLLGFIKKQVSSEDETLFLYTYTSKVIKFPEYWNIFTLVARGIILKVDEYYDFWNRPSFPPNVKILAYPFPKFFNQYEDVDLQFIEKYATEFEVTTKMDGSLGILFYNPSTHEWNCATKGSFNSEQAKFGKKFLSKLITTKSMTPGHTFLVEIIYSKNKIILDYGDFEGFILLSAYDHSGIEYPRWKLENFIDLLHSSNSRGWCFCNDRAIKLCAKCKVLKHNRDNFILVKNNKTFDSFDKLAQYLTSCENEEGFVIKYKLGNGYHRFKWKSNSYLKKQQIQQKLSPKSVLKEFTKSDEHILEMRENIPDNLCSWFDDIVSDFQNQIEAIIKRISIQLTLMEKYGNHTTNKKTIIQWFNDVGIWSDGKVMTRADRALILKAYSDKNFETSWIQKTKPLKQNKDRTFICNYINI